MVVSGQAENCILCLVHHLRHTILKVIIVLSHRKAGLLIKPMDFQFVVSRTKGWVGSTLKKTGVVWPRSSFFGNPYWYQFVIGTHKLLLQLNPFYYFCVVIRAA